MTRRSVTLLATSVLVALLLGVGLWLPVPFVVEGPGPVANTLGQVNGKPLIAVTGHPTYPTSGQLDLTTVSQNDKLTLWGALVDYLSSDRAVLPKEITQTPGQSTADLQREYQRQMTESQKSAVSAALHELSIPATVTVSGVAEGSPAAGKLQDGDVLLAVDGRPVRDAVDVEAEIGAAPGGTPVQVRFRRGKAAPVEISVLPHRGADRGAASSGGATRQTIGVDLDEHRAVHVDLHMVSINGQAVGGPSAGLMFALGIYDVMTPGSLTNGQTIAGTGTIGPDGTVGPIGGIQQKLLGAQRNGARVFLTPAANCPEARRAVPPGLRLVEVNTLDEAVRYLAGIGQGRSDPPSC